MSRLIAATIVAVNGVRNTTAKAGNIAASRIKSAVDVTDPSGCNIDYEVGYGADNAIVRVGEARATILSRANAANTTNNLDIISLTRKNTDGSTTTVYQRVEDILYVYPHPDSSADSLVVCQDATKTSTYSYKADQTVAQIATAANA